MVTPSRILPLALLSALPSALLCGAAEAAYDGSAIRAALARPVLPPSAATSCWARAFSRLAALDRAADEAWSNLDSTAALDARRTRLRAALRTSFEPLPARSPLNARVTRRVKGEGWRAECVVFESVPGVFVTGNLFLPDDARFKPPYPAVLVTCGHSENAKGAPGYNRMSALLAKNGLAGFIVDPPDQGERRHDPFVYHDAVGVRAALVGWPLSAAFVWDNVRALDYLVSRSDIDASRLGSCGNSGGGTASAHLTAFDPRIRAAAPCCYLTSLRELCRTAGPQDLEQLVPGQLAFGLNHAGYVLVSGAAVLQCGTYGDFFSYAGFRSTREVIAETAARLGFADREEALVVPGSHAWHESHRLGTVAWFRRWLCDDGTALPLDRAALAKADAEYAKNGFAGLDTGLVTPSDDCGCEVTPTGRTRDLPGFRDPYDLVRARLRSFERARPLLTGAALAKRVRELAKIGEPQPFEDVRAGSDAHVGDLTFERHALVFADGFRLPAVVVTAPDMTTAPTLIFTDGERVGAVGGVESVVYRKRRSPMVVVDLSGWGETGAAKRPYDEDCVARMLYLTGETLVGWRAEDVVASVRFARMRFGRDVRCDVLAGGRTAIPVAHARAVHPELFGAVALNAPPNMPMAPAPKSWRDMVMVADGIPPMGDVVPGALAAYDWPELLETQERK